MRENDPDSYIATGVISALYAPAHQEIIRTQQDLIKRYVRRVERPGCITIYVVILILGACVAAYYLWGVARAYTSPFIVSEVGYQVLESIRSSGVLIGSQDREEAGKSVLSMVQGALLAVIAWNLLIALGLWKMKIWARWLLLGAYGLSLALSLISFYWNLFAIVLILRGAELSYSGNIFTFLGLLAISLIFIWWFAQHKEWDRTLP